MPGVRERLVDGAYERAVGAGRVPRRPYAHYFIETDGLHSRLHLQNFYSTFWPSDDARATAHVTAFDDRGSRLGSTDVELPPFGSMFLEVSDLLARIGATATEGIVAVDLEPTEGLRENLADLPSPSSVGINTPFWMAYYDADQNYMYVHSIEVLAGAVAGTTAPVAWHLRRAVAQRETWRSWRLLDVDLLEEIQVVAVNHGTEAGSTTVGLFDADGPVLWEQRVDLAPRALERVRVPADVIRSWRAERPGLQVRIGLDPLLTTNGKPYVMMRYGGGPLSLHHG